MESLGLTPDNLERLTIFLLPGLIFLFVFFFLIPDRKKSDLSFIFLSVLMSVLLRTITVWLFDAVNFITDLKLNLIPEGILFDWSRVVLSVGLAALLAKVIQTKRFRLFLENKFNVKAYPFGRLWNDFLKVNHDTAVRVFLKDGAVYVGQLGRVSQDPDDNVQEIELLNPYEYDNSRNGKGRVNKIKETESMLVEAGAISSIEKIKDEEGRKLYDF